MAGGTLGGRELVGEVSEVVGFGGGGALGLEAAEFAEGGGVAGVEGGDVFGGEFEALGGGGVFEVVAAGQEGFHGLEFKAGGEAVEELGEDEVLEVRLFGDGLGEHFFPECVAEFEVGGAPFRRERIEGGGGDGLDAGAASGHAFYASKGRVPGIHRMPIRGEFFGGEHNSGGPGGDVFQFCHEIHQLERILLEGREGRGVDL